MSKKKFNLHRFFLIEEKTMEEAYENAYHGPLYSSIDLTNKQYKNWYEIKYDVFEDLKYLKEAYKDSYNNPGAFAKLTTEQKNFLNKDLSVTERIKSILEFITDKGDIKELKKVLKKLRKKK